MAEDAPQVDIEDETPAAKSAEDRKAAAALSKLDRVRDDDSGPAREVDQEAVSRAMNSLDGAAAKKLEVKKVKVDAADVALLVSRGSRLGSGIEEGKEPVLIVNVPRSQVEELELSKAKATDLLKAHDGDAVKAMRAFNVPVVA
jgi:hypothetical protein